MTERTRSWVQEAEMSLVGLSPGNKMKSSVRSCEERSSSSAGVSCGGLDIWLRCILGIALWRFSGHVLLGRDPRTDPELIREIMTLSWDGLGIPQEKQEGCQGGVKEKPKLFSEPEVVKRVRYKLWTIQYLGHISCNASGFVSFGCVFLVLLSFMSRRIELQFYRRWKFISFPSSPCRVALIDFSKGQTATAPSLSWDWEVRQFCVIVCVWIMPVCKCSHILHIYLYSM